MATRFADTRTTALGFLERERTVARPGFNRWLLPPCALAIHLCIGMAYGFSIFWLPLTRAVGITDSVVCKGMTLGEAMTTTVCDWRVSDLVWIYAIFFVVLGAAAALWGAWLERAGPRKAGVVAACCWCGGTAIGAIGISIHQLWLLWIGTGLIGGIGLGLGYISPVSTLIKWFPDKRGMATGMAIMGFGGGAMIGSPLADRLMAHFAGPTQVGVWQTFLVLALIYFVFMMSGALGYRVPPEGWRPANWTPPPEATRTSITGAYVPLNVAHKTPQFWLIWLVLLLNVSASIGIIGVASPMLQEVFGGGLIGHPGLPLSAFGTGDKKAAAAAGAAFVGMIGLFNIAGRFVWAAASDKLGRKITYAIMTALGALLYGFAAPLFMRGSTTWFILIFCICASLYGGAFATLPAYLADTFGTKFVGAIHGRILTAWSTAGLLGPYIVTAMRDSQIAAGLPQDGVYKPICWVLGGLLVVAFVLNLQIKPVNSGFHLTTEDPVSDPATDTAPDSLRWIFVSTGWFDGVTALAWAAVWIPIAWGIYETFSETLVLLRHG